MYCAVLHVALVFVVGLKLGFCNTVCVQAENKRLQAQTMEMENFLADYGLVWVGDDQYVHWVSSICVGVW